MPLYFFQCDDGAPFDTEGTELPDVDAARVELVSFMAEVMRDRPAFVWNRGGLSVKMTDAAGTVLGTMKAVRTDASVTMEAAQEVTA